MISALTVAELHTLVFVLGIGVLLFSVWMAYRGIVAAATLAVIVGVLLVLLAS